MQGTPIMLDRERNLRFGMRAISYIEKTLKIPIQKLDMDMMTMEQAAIVILAGLRHEDNDLTSERVMELIDKHSNISNAFEALGQAMEESLGQGAVAEDSEGEGKNA